MLAPSTPASARLPACGAATHSSAFSPIRRGGLVVFPNWLESEHVSALREDVFSLDAAKQFKSSGVATAGIDGAYGENDRRVCILSASSTRHNNKARVLVESRLSALCHDLRRELRRPTLSTTSGEKYYSLTTFGASLGMHMDERHEQTKGECGWETTTRRSISWLLYLSDDAVRGGELRAYCRRAAPHATCGAHNGNLQIGWLDGSVMTADGPPTVETLNGADEPVYLDAWVRERTAGRDDSGLHWRARSALYRLQHDGMRQDLTPSFGADSPAWATAAAGLTASADDDDDGDSGMSPVAFAAALRAMLPSEPPALRDAFSSVEAVPHPRQQVVDVSPDGGTLVLFDSAAVPHEVLPTLAGSRIALAGWMHEDSQDYPEWFGT